MDSHTAYTSLATLRNISRNLETQMQEKHREMTVLRNNFLATQRQYKDLQKIIRFLERKHGESI